jgi:hypothetical protein
MVWMAPARGVMLCQSRAALSHSEEPSMSELATSVSTSQRVSFRSMVWTRTVKFSCAANSRRIQLLAFFEKRPRCLIGMEACPGSHDWGHRLQKMGHDVRLMPPSNVNVKRGETDAADAAAICEAVTRPSMRFVAIRAKPAHRFSSFTARGTFWCASAHSWATRSGLICRSSVSKRRRARRTSSD